MPSLLILAAVGALSGAPSLPLYRAEFLQAAPGRLPELVEEVRSRQGAYAAAGDAAPLVIRHSQGDRWDLMLLVPMGDDAASYWAPARVAKREAAGLAGPAHDARWHELVAWHEEVYVRGPALADLQRDAAGSGFAHVEIFQALAGHYDALRTERLMEAAFNEHVGRTHLYLFEREPSLGGGPWDMFTIDMYRDLRHYAEVSSFSPDAGDAAARKAGFANSAAIGPTMRTHIATHHDTIGSVVK